MDRTVPKIAIVYYSMYGHVRLLALDVKKGLEAAGCSVTLLRCAETLPADVLAKMGAPGVGAEDVIATADALAEFDGIMFGIPTRFGMAPAQVKALLDSTGGLWQAGALVGKPAGVFFSTGTQNGGQETTALTFVTQLVHHGMLFVPMGYSNPKMFDLSEPHGGSPYGAGTIAGPDGSRMPSVIEKDLATHHGNHFGKIATRLFLAKA
jgi:NAD(P)H dehydrogenase (quinone)